MAQVKTEQRCANPLCSCTVTSDKYCSVECEVEAAGHTKSTHCECGHEECRKKPHAAKVQIGY